MAPVGQRRRRVQRRRRIPWWSVDRTDGARHGATDWKALRTRAPPERHRVQPQRHRADHRFVSASAWNSLALPTQSNVTGTTPAGGFTLTSTTSCPRLHPGLTKARPYDGEAEAAYCRQPSGNSVFAPLRDVGHEQQVPSDDLWRRHHWRGIRGYIWRQMKSQ